MNEIFLQKTLLSVLGLIAGMFSMWLGYRLFDRVASSRGEFEGRAGNYSVTIRNYGPGVFFCLFGAVMIVVAMTRTYSHVTRKSGDANSGQYEEYVADSAAAQAFSSDPASSVDDPGSRH